MAGVQAVATKAPRKSRKISSPSASRQPRAGAAGGLPRDIVFDPRLFLKKVGGGKSSRDYPSDEAVFSQGDKADAVYYIQSGKVKLTVVSKRGKEAVVALLSEGSFFGEGCLAGQPCRMSTASTVQRSTVVRVQKPAMLGLLHQDPEFAEKFLQYLLSRNIRMEADLV